MADQGRREGEGSVGVEVARDREKPTCRTARPLEVRSPRLHNVAQGQRRRAKRCAGLVAYKRGARAVGGRLSTQADSRSRRDSPLRLRRRGLLLTLVDSG